MEKQAVPAATRVDGKKKTVRLFECLFCDKTFLKSQALGGHQKAHCREGRLGCFSDPYGDSSFGGSTLFATVVPSSGRSMATHGGGVAASTPPADACRPERRAVVVDQSQGGDPVASGAGEMLDLELRL